MYYKSVRGAPDSQIWYIRFYALITHKVDVRRSSNSLLISYPSSTSTLYVEPEHCGFIIIVACHRGLYDRNRYVACT